MLGLGGANFLIESFMLNLFEALFSSSNDIVKAVLKDEESSFFGVDSSNAELVDESASLLWLLALLDDEMSFSAAIAAAEAADEYEASSCSLLVDDVFGPSLLLLHDVTVLSAVCVVSISV